MEYSTRLLRKAERLALAYDPAEGFYLAFSGGKDSQALYHVAKLAGVKFRAHMNLTSVDPAPVIRFVKREYPSVELVKPRMSIYEMAKKKRLAPTRLRRWCCKEYKEMSGAGKVTLIGIRHEESLKRAKRGEVSTQIKGQREETNFDQFSAHEEKMVTCVGGKDKILISPIIEWTTRDVWEFLNAGLGVPHCELYDKGQHRIGCLCCPMSSRKQKLRDVRDYPHVRRCWLKTFQWLVDNGYTPHAGIRTAEDASHGG